MINLFTNKYTFQEKMDVLSKLERAAFNDDEAKNNLHNLIQEHHPSYFAKGHSDPVQKILLWKAMKAFHEGGKPEELERWP